MIAVSKTILDNFWSKAARQKSRKGNVIKAANLSRKSLMSELCGCLGLDSEKFRFAVSTGCKMSSFFVLNLILCFGQLPISLAKKSTKNPRFDFIDSFCSLQSPVVDPKLLLRVFGCDSADKKVPAAFQRRGRNPLIQFMPPSTSLLDL